MAQTSTSQPPPHAPELNRTSMSGVVGGIKHKIGDGAAIVASAVVLLFSGLAPRHMTH